MTIFRGDSKKPLRDWLISSADAANALHIGVNTFRDLVDEGFMAPAGRKGFFRMGALLDGYAEAVRMGRIPAPHARTINPTVFRCQLPATA